MKIDHVSMTYGRRQNLGNFSTANVEATFAALLAETDDPVQVQRELLDLARSSVKDALMELMRQIHQQNGGDGNAH